MSRHLPAPSVPCRIRRGAAATFACLLLGGCASISIGIGLPIGGLGGVGVTLGSDGRVGVQVGVGTGNVSAGVGATTSLPGRPGETAAAAAAPAASAATR